MATIIEKIDKCWNSTTKIEYNDKITVYRLEKSAKLFSEVSVESWGKDSKDSNKLIIVKRSEYSSIQYETILIVV